MKIIKEILARIWALWGLVLFIATMLLFIIPICITYLIPDPTGIVAFSSLTRYWMLLYLPLIGCRYRMYGKENIHPQKNYVVIVNHKSLLDIPLITPFLPGGNKTIAKKSMAKIPFFGWIYTRGSVLVDRSNKESRRNSFEKMKEVLNKNVNMVIYPEGTRNKTRQPLKSFYNGAFKLAVSQQKNILPVCILGTAKALPINKKFFLWPTRLEVHILPEISCINNTPENLKEAAYKIMWNFIEKNNKI